MEWWKQREKVTLIKLSIDRNKRDLCSFQFLIKHTPQRIRCRSRTYAQL